MIGDVCAIERERERERDNEMENNMLLLLSVSSHLKLSAILRQPSFYFSFQPFYFIFCARGFDCSPLLS